MKYSLFFVSILLLAGMMISSCNKSRSEDDNKDIDRLYSETCRLTKVYTDSMAHAKDSTALMDLMKRFDERLTNLNFSVRAETDYHLSEGMNDTISMLVDSLRRVYDNRLYRLGHPGQEVADSLSHDSLPEPPSRTSRN